LPIWLAANLQRGGILEIEWEGTTRLGIEKHGPGLVGLLGPIRTPAHERQPCNVDLEMKTEGDHQVLCLVARGTVTAAAEIMVKIPASESSRFTDVVIRHTTGEETAFAGHVRHRDHRHTGT
jgi:hypothetical protein